jgi:hypothetical protein
MEPVVFPKHITPVNRTDRVKRNKPREDQRRGGAFAHHLHQDTEEQAEGDAAGEDEYEQAARYARALLAQRPSKKRSTFACSRTWRG